MFPHHRLLILLLTLAALLAACGDEQPLPPHIARLPASTLTIVQAGPHQLPNPSQIGPLSPFGEIRWSIEAVGLTADEITIAQLIHTGRAPAVIIVSPRAERAWSGLREEMGVPAATPIIPINRGELPAYVPDREETWAVAQLDAQTLVVGGASAVEAVVETAAGRAPPLSTARPEMAPIVAAFAADEFALVEIMDQATIDANEQVARLGSVLAPQMRGLMRMAGDVRAIGRVHHNVAEGCALSIVMQFAGQPAAVFAEGGFRVLSAGNMLVGGSGGMSAPGVETTEISRDGTLVRIDVAGRDDSPWLCADPSLSDPERIAERETEADAAQPLEICGTLPIIAERGARVRAAPDIEADVIATLPKGAQMELLCGDPVMADGEIWLRVRYDGQVAWMALSVLAPEQ
jgi:hypothetical protein